LTWHISCYLSVQLKYRFSLCTLGPKKFVQPLGSNHRCVHLYLFSSCNFKYLPLSWNSCCLFFFSSISFLLFVASPANQIKQDWFRAVSRCYFKPGLLSIFFMQKTGQFITATNCLKQDLGEELQVLNYWLCTTVHKTGFHLFNLLASPLFHFFLFKKCILLWKKSTFRIFKKFVFISYFFKFFDLWMSFNFEIQVMVLHWNLCKTGAKVINIYGHNLPVNSSQDSWHPKNYRIKSFAPGLNPTNKNFLFRKILCKNQKILTPPNFSQKSEKLSWSCFALANQLDIWKDSSKTLLYELGFKYQLAFLEI
jgi:hypothetical protein